ncbi:MAG: ATP-binding protein [Rhodothermales bacterium]
MIPQSVTPFGHWNGLAEVHRDTYRVFCVIAGVLNPVFGLVYQVTDPGAIDPLWGRFALSALSLLLLSLSYMVPWVEANFIVLVRGYFYVLMANIVGLTMLNGFSYQYALGMLFGFTAMGVAFGLGLSKRAAPLVRFLVTVVALAVGAGLLVPEPEANLWIVWVCAASTALIIYVVAYAKIRGDESAEASEHRYRTLMNAASDAILIADPSTGGLIDANEKARELLGRPLEEVRRMRIAEVFPSEERARYVALFEAQVFKKEPITEDLFIVGRTGESIPVDVSASLVDVDGRKLIQAIFRRHRYEEQLIQAKERAEELLRLKTSLLNNMSHELRTPLTAILGFAELLEEEAEGEQQEHARVISNSAKRLYETVTSVLGLAQLEGGTSAMTLRPLDVSSHVAESVDLLRPLADRKGVGLRVVRHEADAWAEADEPALSRVINNLVGNAIKFTEKGGTVAVIVDADDGHVRVRVQDTGVGISEAFLPRLFEEFRQESTGLARSHEGSGLGLAITKRLIEQMGGTIEAESTKGTGSVFTVKLGRVPAATPVSMPRLPVVPQASRKRILLVEDNADTRHIVRHRLQSLCHVDVASDPTRALELAAQHHYDAFILDINLAATQDGIGLLYSLRRMRRYEHTPSAALTAYAMPGDEEWFRAVGFDHYLSKPFTKQQLFHLFMDLFPRETASLAAQNTSHPTYTHA